MKFIRDNIVKILLVLAIVIILIIVLMACSNANNMGFTGSYSKMEDNFVNAATKFLQNKQDLLPTEEGKVVQVQMNTVYNEKQMEKMTAIDDSSVKCDGYVNVSFRLDENDEKVYRITPHIKCADKYETEDLYSHILENEEVVTSLDGLYKINNEYIYRGESPNNYLTINEYTYRIMSLDEEGFIKIITGEGSLFPSVWDDRYNVETGEYSGINDYSLSRLREYSKEIFNDPESFADEEKNLFVKQKYCIGKRSEERVSIDKIEECQVMTDEDYFSFPLMYDYFIASADSNCKTIIDESCNNYNYLFELGARYTATGSKERSDYAFLFGSMYPMSKTNETHDVAFVFNLSDVIYVSGKGTKDDPYIIK